MKNAASYSRLIAFRLSSVALIIAWLASCVHDSDRRAPAGDLVTISVIGTNDIHGQFLPYEERGGITTLSGYVAALREIRAEDGGVLLIDGGDMWQGSLESNLNEGALMLQAFNALGYAASTIGNHEFDFGPVGDRPIPVDPNDDPRGALKQRASEAAFPLLAANLLDEATGMPVKWENVRPSTTVEVAGVRIGIVGILTEDTLLTTISANVEGLRIGPLADAVVREATLLREQGADVVVVTAHAGGRCTEYADPRDLSSCSPDSEIFALARSLPPGLIDVINGGHEAYAIAHYVDDIAVMASLAYARTMSRTDLVVDRASNSIVDVRIHPPQRLCPAMHPTTRECAWRGEHAMMFAPARYEGLTVRPMDSVRAIAQLAAARSADVRLQDLGVTLADRFTRDGSPESALGNLVLTALRDSVEADAVILNVKGGLRSDLPPGELLYGHLYQMFPFDNRIAIIEMSGRDLRRVFERQAHNHRRRAGVGGLVISVTCDSDRMTVDMVLDDGRSIADDDKVRVAANDFLAMGGDAILTPAMPDDGFIYDEDPRLVRDVIADWLRQTGGMLYAGDYAGVRQWNLPNSVPADCAP